MNHNADRLPARRGGALLTLGGVVGLWLVLRIALWVPPFAPASLSALPVGPLPVTGAQSAAMPVGAATPQGEYAPPIAPLRPPPVHPAPIIPQRQAAPLPTPWRAPVPSWIPPAEQVAHGLYSRAGTAGSRRAFVGADRLVGHALLLQAAYRGERGGGQPRHAEAALAARQADVNGAPAPIFAPQAAREMRALIGEDGRGFSRWSMDAWALWRRDNDSPLVSGRPSYGRSQAGAVLRYNLAPAGGHAPQAYVRASMALEGRQEREAALGAAVRPVPGIPVRFAAEARVSETDAGTELRAAGFAVSELPPIMLPAGFSAEAYVQGGYVTGNFSTPFVDGQARVTRTVAGADDFRLSAGGGAWGGAQEDAHRVDVGPSAELNFRVGPARGRISADYRFRVAGDAQPSSGPALTLSAGF